MASLLPRGECGYGGRGYSLVDVVTSVSHSFTRMVIIRPLLSPACDLDYVHLRFPYMYMYQGFTIILTCKFNHTVDHYNSLYALSAHLRCSVMFWLQNGGLKIATTLWLVILYWNTHTPQVFFPMLTRLLADLPCSDRASVEETRVRGSNLLCKVRKITI